MATVPSRAADRIAANLKKFQPVVQSAKQRDVNESDTVIIVTDMLSEWPWSRGSALHER